MVAILAECSECLSILENFRLKIVRVKRYKWQDDHLVEILYLELQLMEYFLINMYFYQEYGINFCYNINIFRKQKWLDNIVIQNSHPDINMELPLKVQFLYGIKIFLRIVEFIACLLLH